MSTGVLSYFFVQQPPLFLEPPFPQELEKTGFSFVRGREVGEKDSFWYQNVFFQQFLTKPPLLKFQRIVEKREF